MLPIQRYQMAETASGEAPLKNKFGNLGKGKPMNHLLAGGVCPMLSPVIYPPRTHVLQDRKFFDSADHEMGAAGVKKEGTGHVIATAQTVPKRGPAPRTSALVR